VFATGTVWMNAENLAPTGIRSLDRRGHYTNYAIPAHNAM